MKREEILKGAAKYIAQFKDKCFVVKYGGSLLDEQEISESILDDVICLYEHKIKTVIVHGGGLEISRLMKEKGKQPRFISGLRVTDEETARIVDEALTNINTGLIKRIREKGFEAESLVSRERLTIRGKKKLGLPAGDFTGDVASVETRYINEVLAKGSIPVVSPVGVDEENRIFNINADIAAAEIAAALFAEKFIMLTDVIGVMMRKNDEKSLISTLHEAQAQKLINDGVIASGMIPKVHAGILALDKGVHKVHMISGEIRHSLLIEVFTDKGIGTEIVHNE